MLERVMIISGESSGELYGALLAKMLKSRNPQVSIMGVGGERMEAAGVNIISRISSAFGLTEAARAYREIRKTFRMVGEALSSFHPQVLVLIDYPDFNMKVAGDARKQGIKVQYYVSPQVWAWRKGRVKTLGRLIDQMAVILPFEEELYRTERVPCEFVGHPVTDEIREIVHDLGCRMEDIGTAELKSQIKAELGLAPDRPVLTLMPGSRPHEIEKLLATFADVAKTFRSRYPHYQLVLPMAPNLDQSHFARFTAEKECRLLRGRAVEVLLASDAAVIASGTSTLQAALLKVPMVVVYRLSPFTYFMGRLIIKVNHIALVNVLLDKAPSRGSGLRIKELLQGSANSENVMGELGRIIEDTEYRREMTSLLETIGDFFVHKRPSLRVSEMIETLAAGE